jgi:hypothetical protein
MEKLNKWLVRHKKAFRDGSRYLVEHSINVKDILNGKLESELLPRLISDINEVIDEYQELMFVIVGDNKTSCYVGEKDNLPEVLPLVRSELELRKDDKYVSICIIEV